MGLNPKQKFKIFTKILMENTCLMSFRNTFNKMIFYLNVLILQLLSKMTLLNGKIVTCLIWPAHCFFKLLFHPIFGWRLFPLLCF